MNQNNQQEMAQKIRARYEEKKTTELDELRTLDAKVRRPAAVFAYVFGSIGAIVMGCGMSLVMTDIAQIIGWSKDPMISGIILGGIGMIMALLNYPIYQGILKSRKKKYAHQILTLSETIIK